MCGIIWEVPTGHVPERSPHTVKVAQADLRCPELAQSSSADKKKAQSPLRSPPRTSSLHWGASPPWTHSRASPDPALWAVQAAIERRRQQEEVGSHQSCTLSPRGCETLGAGRCCYRACP